MYIVQRGESVPGSYQFVKNGRDCSAIQCLKFLSMCTLSMADHSEGVPLHAFNPIAYIYVTFEQ